MPTPPSLDAEKTRERLDRVERELEFHLTVTTAILGTLDLEKILYVLLSGVTSGDGLGFNRAFLFLDDDAGRDLRITMALGPPDQQAALEIWDTIDRQGLHLPELLRRFEDYRQQPSAQALTRKLAGFSLPLCHLPRIAVPFPALVLSLEAELAVVLAHTLTTRSPFASNGLTLRHEIGGAAGEVVSFRNFAIVPLLVHNRLIGAILADNIYSGRAVGSDDLRRLHLVSNLAAMAIERARLHAKTVAMAEVDGLTGVYNRRHYEEEIARNLEAAARTGSAFAMVILDPDRFKRINDAHGHLVGDQVLKEIARLLVENVRGTDVVARYGGDEFVVLLAETSVQAAAQVAEKLRDRVKQSALAGGVVSGLTLSAGVAGSQGRESPEQLFERADRALYAAKEGGRDRVVTDGE
jgi:diguanylate cyclase (GGDEF)-like protein